MGPAVHTKTYIFRFFYQQYLVLATMVPRNRLEGDLFVADSMSIPPLLAAVPAVLATYPQLAYGVEQIKY